MKPEYLTVIEERGYHLVRLGKLNPEFKARWLEALRSGRYSQTVGCLRRDFPPPGYGKGFCCLGVGADVLEPNAWTTTGARVFWRGRYYGALGQRDMELIGLTFEAQSLLQGLNDDLKWTFTDIANFIEEVL